MFLQFPRIQKRLRRAAQGIRVRRVDRFGLVLEVVAAKMLDARARTFALHSRNVLFCERTRKIRVFAEIFKITPVERVAVNVHAGSQERVNLVLAELQAFPLIQFRDKTDAEDLRIYG